MRPFFHAFPAEYEGPSSHYARIRARASNGPASKSLFAEDRWRFLARGTSGPILSEGCNCFPEFAWGREIGLGYGYRMSRGIRI
ncbi:hypothetical protein CEXT_360751 [Caerostris extrusa]|uniref:Uncharacterized protein n=1 Tax=Caerostris extrusa TaxID=172846 RepID=A0AAV4XHT4_CAEEX|nr:hypothetical protein CEXT_360751 [Caerostris extrusa]